MKRCLNLLLILSLISAESATATPFVAAFAAPKKACSVELKLSLEKEAERVSMAQVIDHLQRFLLASEQDLSPWGIGQILEFILPLNLTDALENLPPPEKLNFYKATGVDSFGRTFQSFNEQAARPGADFAAFLNTLPHKAVSEFYLRSLITAKIAHSQSVEIHGLQRDFENDLAIRFAFLVADFETVLNLPPPLTAKVLTNHLLKASEDEQFKDVHRSMLQKLTRPSEREKMVEAYIELQPSYLARIRSNVSAGTGVAAAIGVSYWLFPSLKGVVTTTVGLAATVALSLLATAVTINSLDIVVWNQKRHLRARAEEKIRTCNGIFWNR